MSEKLKIVYRPLQELSPYAHNARTHSPEQVAQLVESIKQFGWTNPVLIDEKGEIIAGHGRVMAAEMLKMDSVPVIVLSGLTDEQKKAYRLADNRLPMNAGWDEDLLRMELSDLINADFDVSLTGFIPTEIDELLTDVLPGTGNEEEPYTTKIDTPVYEPSGGKPDNGFCIDSFDIQFDNKLQTQRCIGTGSPYAGANIPTTFTPSGTVTLSWSKAAWEIWSKTLTGETVPFSFTLSNGEGAYTFSFPKVQVSGEWPDGGNSDIIQVQLSITAADEAPTITRKKNSPAAVIAKASAEAIS